VEYVCFVSEIFSDFLVILIFWYYFHNKVSLTSLMEIVLLPEWKTWYDHDLKSQLIYGRKKYGQVLCICKFHPYSVATQFCVMFQNKIESVKNEH